MEAKRRASKFFSLKSCLFLVLVIFTANSYAMYLGNPNRPGTVWQPPHCKNGCWHDGYYIKFLDKPCCRDVVWIDGQYDRRGNWIPAHYKVVRYVVVNPGSEANYVGFPM